MRLLNDIWDRSRFCRGSNSEKSETGPISWTFWYNLIKFCIPITTEWARQRDCQNLAQEIAKWHLTSVEALPSSKFWKHIYFIIRIFNGYELWIDNSVTTVTVQHRVACRVMPNSYPEWRDFQFAPNNHYGFFFLHTLPSTIAFWLKYVFVYQFYAEQK